MSISLYLQSNISLGLKVKIVYVTKYVLTYNNVIKALASNVSINLHQFQFKLLISTCGQQTYRGIPSNSPPMHSRTSTLPFLPCWRFPRQVSDFQLPSSEGSRPQSSSCNETEPTNHPTTLEALPVPAAT